MESFSLLLVAVVLIGFFTIIFTFATRKKTGKIGKQKGRAQIIRDASRKLAQDPHSPVGLIPLGELYYNERAWDKALPIYETQMSIAPAHKEIDPFLASLRQGICAVKLNKIAEAFKGLSAAVQMKPGDFDVNYYLGTAYFKNNEFEKAIPYFKKALVLKAEAGNITGPLGLSLYKAKHYKESLPYLKRALDENPENKELLFSMADSMNESGYGEKAMKVFMHLRPDPEFGAKSCLAAGLNHSKAQPEKAIQDFEIGLRHQNIPQDLYIELNYRMAACCFSLKQIAKGLQCLNAIQAINPQYKDVPQLIHRYQELNQNKNLQIYIMSSSSDFVALCRRVVMHFYQKASAKIMDISVTPDNVEVLLHVEFSRSEEDHIYRFYRSTGVTSDLGIRDFHGKLTDSRADKGICVTAGTFSEEARKYVEGRPIDLIEKEGLVRILKKVDAS